jgi:hypothetical protein
LIVALVRVSAFDVLVGPGESLGGGLGGVTLICRVVDCCSCTQRNTMEVRQFLTDSPTLEELEDLQTQLHQLLVDKYGSAAAAAVSIA